MHWLTIGMVSVMTLATTQCSLFDAQSETTERYGVSTSTLIDAGVIESYDDLTPGQKAELKHEGVHPFYTGSIACQAVNDNRPECKGE